MEMYNRYPEIFKKISILQYEVDRIEYDEMRGTITYRRQKDMFYSDANIRNSFGSMVAIEEEISRKQMLASSELM